MQPTPEIVHATLIGEAGDCASFGVSVYDDDGRIVAVNEHAATMLGYTRDELLARDVGGFTDGGIDRTVLRGTDLREGVRLVQRKDGTRIPVAFIVSPTRVSRLPYILAVSWELQADDPRSPAAR
jgi:PAS domain S-box-containing protein